MSTDDEPKGEHDGWRPRPDPHRVREEEIRRRRRVILALRSMNDDLAPYRERATRRAEAALLVLCGLTLVFALSTMWQSEQSAAVMEYPWQLVMVPFVLTAAMLPILSSTIRRQRKRKAYELESVASFFYQEMNEAWENVDKLREEKVILTKENERIREYLARMNSPLPTRDLEGPDRG